MSVLLKPASLHFCPEYWEATAVSGKAGERARPVVAAFLKNKGFCFCGVGGKSHCCESLFHQKAVQMRGGKRLPAGQNHECPAFLLPAMLLFQAVLTCLPMGLAFRGGG